MCVAPKRIQEIVGTSSWRHRFDSSLTIHFLQKPIIFEKSEKEEDKEEDSTFDSVDGTPVVSTPPSMHGSFGGASAVSNLSSGSSFLSPQTMLPSKKKSDTTPDEAPAKHIKNQHRRKPIGRMLYLWAIRHRNQHRNQHQNRPQL